MQIIDGQSLQTKLPAADICVVGAGPAGLTLARELADTGLRVCLIESGGHAKRLDTEKLNNTQSEGNPYPNTRHTRRRQIGGTSERWCIEVGPDVLGVRYGALDQVDFEARAGLPESGWPLDKAALSPFYERAQVVCGLGPFEYDAAYWETPSTPRLPFKSDTLTSGVYQFGPRAIFAGPHPTPYDAAHAVKQANITLIYNVTVQEVETDASGARAVGVRAITYDGRPLRIPAERVVLAMGGIETVRLLWLSTGHNQHPRGLGNDYDQLGRYFMDHAQAHFGTLRPRNREVFEQASLYDMRWQPQGGYAVMGMVKPSDEAQRREKLLNMGYILYPRREIHLTKTFQAYHEYADALSNRYIPPHLKSNLVEMLRHPRHMLSIAGRKLTHQNHYYDLSHGGWSGLSRKDHCFDVFEVVTQIEQAPHPENRVMLSDAVDDYGQRRALINWRWFTEDTRQVQRSRALFAAEVARAGLGEACFPEAPYHVASSHHHIGGARMSVDPAQGVVDKNCKVHGLENVYVASSAVFPTGGYIGPTLTIVALAVRLADHLKNGPAVEEIKPLEMAFA